jgi:hypothetical protein
MFRLIFCFLFFVPVSLVAQTQMNYDGSTEEHMLQFTERNREQKTRGFRVQLISASGPDAKNQIQAARNTFGKDYKDHSTYMKWDSPNWKLRAGDFRNRMDAMLFLRQVQSRYPQAFVVADEIRPRNE